MTKEQIIRSISEEFKISELESIQFYENVFSFIEGSFRKSKNLNISEFGKFNVIEKTGADGGRVNSVKFSPSKKLATEVNYNYNNLAKILFRDIERNMNKERILSLGEENIYREPAAESGEVFDRYSEEEKDFIEQQVNLTSNHKSAGLEDLEKRVRKIEAFINVIKKFFEDEKLGETLAKEKTQVVPPQADYIKRVEDEKRKDEQYKASISALEAKIKELESRFTEPKKAEAKEEKIELPPIDVVPPIEERIEEERTVEPEAKTSLPDLGNLVVESDYTEEIKSEERFVEPEITPVEEAKPIIESLTPPEIEEKIEERLKEFRQERTSDVVKETPKKPAKPRDESTRNIDDLLRTLGQEIEEEETVEETEQETKEESKTEDITDKYFIKTEDIIERPSLTEVEEPKAEEIQEPKTEEKKMPDTPLVGDITDSELHKKVDSIIEEFRTESSRIKEEKERTTEEPKEIEPEVTKPLAPQDAEEAQLSTALSSIFNSILQSENIKQEPPIIKEETKNLHDEIVKSEKPAETIEPPKEERKQDLGASISDIYSSAKSFNDIFESKEETEETKKEETNGHGLKEETNGHGLKETNGHGLKETNGHGLKETNGHGLKETNGHGLKETNGHGLTEHGMEHDVRTSKIYTNGNPLKPYSNGNGKNGNGASTLNQVLEDNGLQKESKTSIFIILIIIIIALGLLFFAIFSSGIMGKENPSLKEKNYGLVKVKDNKNEKYFYDNGKDKVYFQTEKGFTIQAASYKDKEAAIEKRQSLLNKKIDNVRIEELEKDNSTFYRVRIGMFTTLDEAKKYSEKF